MMKKITESTLLPLGLVGSILIVAFYVGVTANRVESHEMAIAKLDKAQENVTQMQTDIAVIRTKVELMEKRTREDE